MPAPQVAHRSILTFPPPRHFINSGPVRLFFSRRARNRRGLSSCAGRVSGLPTLKFLFFRWWSALLELGNLNGRQSWSGSWRRRDKKRIGRDGEIRTPDPLNPIQVRYQTAPRPDPGICDDTPKGGGMAISGEECPGLRSGFSRGDAEKRRRGGIRPEIVDKTRWKTLRSSRWMDHGRGLLSGKSLQKRHFPPPRLCFSAPLREPSTAQFKLTHR